MDIIYLLFYFFLDNVCVGCILDLDVVFDSIVDRW